MLVYTFFSCILGQNGIYVQRHLEAERIKLLENQQSLETMKKDFLKTMNNIKNDPDTFSVYARQFNYGTEEERFIRVKGINVGVNTNMPVGKVLYAEDPEYVSDTAIKVISLFFGLAVLIFFLLKDTILS